MKIKVNQVLKDLKGEDLKAGGEDKEKGLELKVICTNALLSDNAEIEKIDGNEKMTRFLLAEKIQKANELDLTVEEITKIKKVIGLFYGPLLVGRAYNALEGKK